MSDLYLLASEAPGILDGWTGPVEWRDPHGTAWWHGHSDEPDGGYGDIVRLDFRLPEVRDRAMRWYMEREPCGPALFLQLRDNPAALIAEVRAVAAAMVTP